MDMQNALGRAKFGYGRYYARPSTWRDEAIIYDVFSREWYVISLGEPKLRRKYVPTSEDASLSWEVEKFPKKKPHSMEKGIPPEQVRRFIPTH